MNYIRKFISLVIAKTASRNVATKASKMSEAVSDTQVNFVTPEVRVRGQYEYVTYIMMFHQESTSRSTTITLSATLTFIHFKPWSMKSLRFNFFDN